MDINRQFLEKSLQHSCELMGVFLVRLHQGVGLCRREEESIIQNCVLPLYQASKKGWQWLRLVISSRGKPRSQ